MFSTKPKFTGFLEDKSLKSRLKHQGEISVSLERKGKPAQ